MPAVYVKPAEGEPLSREHARPIAVIDELAKLHGPLSGTVHLPLGLDWTPRPDYDISNSRRLLSLYATVLREATTDEELAEFLNASTLAAEWSKIFLPKHIRAEWEKRHPELVSGTVA
jgi:hypothetical protein